MFTNGGPGESIRNPLASKKIFAKKILTMKIRAMGDTVLMTAPVLELIRAYPNSEIHVAVGVHWAPLFEQMPGIAKIWSYERHGQRSSRAKAVARMALKLRREHFDCVVNFHASPSTATMCFAAGAKARAIHFHGHKDKNRYSTVTIPGKGTVKPIIERDMDAVRSLGIDVPEGRYPQIFLSAAEKSWAEGRFTNLGMPQPRLGIGLGASRSAKSWPVERFADLAVRWCKEQKGSAIAVVSPEESRLSHDFLKAVEDALTIVIPDSDERAVIRKRITFVSDLSLRELCAFLSKLDVLAGNDSGPRHLAVAVGLPTVTVFGPEHPFEWHPYRPDRHPFLFVDSLACRKDAMPGMPAWCALEKCVVEEHRCMARIGVEEVLSECRRMATGTSA